MKKFYVGILLGFVLLVAPGVACGQLLQWNTFGNAGTETIEVSVYNDPNISASFLTLGSITAALNGDRFGGSNWFNTGNTVTGNTLTEAIAGNDYIEFIVTPLVNVSFTPTSFVFTWDRSSTGTMYVTLRSSIDGFTTDLGSVSVAASINAYTITISGLTDITSATTFRLYGHGATATGGTGGFDVVSNAVNVQLNGATAAASASGPEINVQGNSISIVDGDTSPSTADSTDFGNACVSLSNVVKSFVIQNTGVSDLTLSGASPFITIGGTNPGEFTVTQVPGATISSGSFTTFQITFTPTGTGSRNASISIGNNDPNENPYNFSISGTGLETAISAQPTDQVITAPNTASFSVTASNVQLYQWQINTGSTWSDISGANLATYSTGGTSIGMDGNLYRCVITGNSPCATVISSQALLTVGEGPCVSDASGYSGWNLNGAVSSSNQACSGNGILFTAAGQYAVTPVIVNPNKLNFNKQKSNNSSLWELRIQISTSATGPWSDVSTVSTITTSCSANPEIDLSAYTGNYYVRFLDTRTSGAHERAIDDIKITCLTSCVPVHSVTSIMPTEGPAGTLVTITGTNFTSPDVTAVKFGSTSVTFTIVNSTTIIAEVPTNATSGKVSIVKSGCTAKSTNDFIPTYQAGTCGAASTTYTGLAISEVYDSDAGSLSYVEIFNPTSSGIALTNYQLKITTYGTSGSGSNVSYFPLTSSAYTLGAGAVYIVRLGDNDPNNPTDCSEVGTPGISYSTGGINGNDLIELQLSGTTKDYVPNPGYTGGSSPNVKGFSQVRKLTATAPSTTFISSDWDLYDVEQCSTLNSPPYVVGNAGINIVTQPVDKSNCSGNVDFSVTATSSGSLQYVWYYNDPSSMSNFQLLSGINGSNGVAITGLASASISITAGFETMQNFQFYCKVKTTGSCEVNSYAVQYSYDSRPIYESRNSGNWSDATTWRMSNDGTRWVDACKYPIASNSTQVTIAANHTVIMDIDSDISIDKLTINTGGILLTNPSAGLTILNGQTGPDFIINGSYIDSANNANSLSFATGASWEMGSNATLVRCNGSGSTVYRDNYEGGISTIPATANWKIRYYGNNVSFTTATGSGSGSYPSATYYPNLTFESYAGAWNPGSTTTSSRFTGNLSTATILGSLDIGGAGTGTVTIYNENHFASPITIAGNLVVRTGSTLTNVGNTDGTGFDIDGNLVVDGKLLLNSGDTGVLKLTGTSVQTMSGTGSVEIFDLELNNSNGAVPNVMHALSDSVYNSLSILGTTRLQMVSGNLTLKSSLSRTARVGAIPASANITYTSGKFIIERYINTGIGHERSWQFLATPVTGQSIYDSWQEQGGTVAGYGTRVTGPTGPDPNTGIDDNTVNPSMKTYNGTTNLWEGIYNTKTTALYNDKGYMLFIRGDRTSMVTPTSQPPAVPTILRSTGTIHQPSAQPGGFTLGANEWKSVGNPYASPISLEYIFANTSSNISQSVSVWDPSMYGYYAVGGYQTISATLNYIPTPASTMLYPTGTPFKDIQSGQAFFIQAGSAGGAISFNENVKSSTDRLVNFAPGNTDAPTASNSFAPNPNSRNTKQIFRTLLCTTSGIVADGNGVAFDRRYNNRIDLHDAYKAYNPGENFGMTRNGNWLAVEARSPIERTDTIFYSMYNLRRQDYQLRFSPENMQGGNLTAWLVDIYLNRRTQVSLADSSFVDISINADAGSSRHDRFYLVFLPRNSNEPKPPTPLPKSRKAEGQAFSAESLKETYEVLNASIYPNPVVDKKIQLRLEGFSSGKYTYNLANAFGQVVTTGQIIVNGTKTINTIVLPKAIATGVYQLNIIGKTYVKSVRTLIQ